MDGLQRFLEEHCPLAGPALNNGDHVSVLKYADDVVLLSDSAEDQQALVSATASFCSAVGLQISAAKSSVLAFFAGTTPRPSIVAGGHVLQTVTQTKYLGLLFHEHNGVFPSFQPRCDKMKTAWAVLQRQYAGLRCSVSLSLLLSLYDACVAPVGSYGCEIWSSSVRLQA